MIGTYALEDVTIQAVIVDNYGVETDSGSARNEKCFIDRNFNIKTMLDSEIVISTAKLFFKKDLSFTDNDRITFDSKKHRISKIIKPKMFGYGTNEIVVV